MSNLPFLDLKAIQQLHADALRSAFERVLDSGWYILGEEVRHFEEEYAAYCGARECVGVANGLDALVLALRALDIGPGDEVLVPANTYIATWLAVSQVGATPVPVEPLPNTANLDPHRLAAALTPRTRAVLPVHLYGQPADLRNDHDNRLAMDRRCLCTGRPVRALEKSHSLANAGGGDPGNDRLQLVVLAVGLRADCFDIHATDAQQRGAGGLFHRHRSRQRLHDATRPLDFWRRRRFFHAAHRAMGRLPRRRGLCGVAHELRRALP